MQYSKKSEYKNAEGDDWRQDFSTLNKSNTDAFEPYQLVNGIS
jgi:hypothetical protein